MSGSTPIDGQEVAIQKYRGDEEWLVDVTDSTFITKLRRAGYEPERDDAALPYRRFRIPVAAISLRSRKGIESRKKAAVGRVITRKPHEVKG